MFTDAKFLSISRELYKGNSLRKSDRIIQMFPRNVPQNSVEHPAEILTAPAKSQTDRESREGTLLLAGDPGTEGIQTDIDFFIASIDLLDIAYNTRTLGRHRSNQHSDTGTYIRRRHLSSP